MKHFRRRPVVETSSHPARISRVRTRSHSSLGVTIVEAALVTPIFLTFIMAIAEGGLYMQNYLAVSNTVQSGARAASASGSSVNADLHIVHNMAKESSAIPRSAIDFIVVYRADGFGATPGEIGEDGIPDDCLAGRPVAGRCNVYTPADFEKAAVQLAEMSRLREAEDAGLEAVKDDSKFTFGCLTTGPHANQSPDRFWCPKDRQVNYSSNGGKGPDFVGVYMKVDHAWLTKIFGTSREINNLSVIRMEPNGL